MRFVVAACLVVIVSLSTLTLAGSPPELDYQGKILIDNIPLNGDGYFKFAIADEDGGTNFWANDGTGAGEPAAFVTNDCFNGVFDTILGAAPMNAIDPTFFGFDTSLFLRVWFSPDGVSFNEMLPQQKLVSSPSALNADMVDGYHAAELISIATNSVTLSGDISGTPGDGTTVDSLQGGALDLGAPGAGEVLTWDGSAWTNAPSAGMSSVVASNSFVRKSGDTMTGDLTINAARGLDINSAGFETEIGRMANAVDTGTAVGADARGYSNGVAVGVAAYGYGYGVGIGASANGAHGGVAVGYVADGTSGGAALGNQAFGYAEGAAVGWTAYGYSNGAAVGRGAMGYARGAAVGTSANGIESGVAVGYAAEGYNLGVGIGNGSVGYQQGVAVGDSAYGLNNGAAVGRQARGTNWGAAIGAGANGSQFGAAVGNGANGFESGAAVGVGAMGSITGAAVGANSRAMEFGAAVGSSSMAFSNGAAIGAFANGIQYGAAVGRGAVGSESGVAVGASANGAYRGVSIGINTFGNYNGVAVGADAIGGDYGVAVGPQAYAPSTNIAIGLLANATPSLASSFERIAIGHEVTNEVNNSIRVRGDLYLDGAFGIYARSPFGIGSFTRILPLPLLDRVIFVSPTSKKPWANGSVDDPFGDLQNAYTFASAWHIGEPATLVICGGNYTNGLNMSGGNVHVVGLDRPQILNLTISAAANNIRGKQRVHNLIVKGTTIVAVDAGADVKFHNCRFEEGLQILGPNVEVQDCFAAVSDGTAVTVGTGGSPIANIAFYNSSFQNMSALNATIVVNANVNNFEILGCQIVNNDNGPCVDDMEPGPLSPTHLYTHNYLRGMPPGVGTMPALRDPVAGATGPTITFVQNTVMGHVGVNSNSQYYAQNIVYGIINNVGGGGFPGWSQAGFGTGPDPSGNIEHELVFPSLPASWMD